MERRAVLRLLGLTATGTVVCVAAPGEAAPSDATDWSGTPGGCRHATGNPRGCQIAVTQGRSAEGRFGLMFKRLPAFVPSDDLLRGLAAGMVDPASLELDNPDSPSGFSFLGQFVDHDMTLDKTPLLDQRMDPTALVNFSSPRFDLSPVYGGGPWVQPELYELTNPARLRLEAPNGVDDLPRRPDGTSIIPDPRNDENLIITQLHVAFIKFHNALIDRGVGFARARQLTRWHYQWVIVHDLLPHFVGQEVVDRFLRRRNGIPRRVVNEFYRPRNRNRPMIPVEFSVAAYRFGHSLVRPSYSVNATASVPLFFGQPADGDLHGSRPLPARFEVEWDRFFEIPGVAGPPANRTRLIDTKLAPTLFHLPVPSVVEAEPAPPIRSLAERDLLRGARLGLPAGQDVARAMGVTPIGNDELGLDDPGWNGKAPLWFYILAEAQRQQGGRLLGEVGGRIVAEVMLGILDADPGSFLHASPAWRPGRSTAPAGAFRMGDLLRFARVA